MSPREATTGAARSESVRRRLVEGTVIPAHPLALSAERTLDERRQRALSRYYIAAGAGGLAVGVHTTQFRIHDSKVGLLRPVWELAAEEISDAEALRREPIIRVAGICGPTRQAVAEASLARELDYDYGLVSLSGLADAGEQGLLEHCRAVAEILPVFGFYLQPAVGGRCLPYGFWRGFCDIERVVAIKVAPFDRYQTLDVVRAVAESGREDIALYTGNDDHILLDLLACYRFTVGGRSVERRFVGGLLGHWAVWTRRAVALHQQCRELSLAGEPIPPCLLELDSAVTDCNAAVFDAAGGFRGCIAGIHEVLRRQGLLAGNWCLDDEETLSPAQADEIGRVIEAYPDLTRYDAAFIAEHLDQWLR